MVPKPFNEAHRLDALRSYCGAKSVQNDALDRLTKLACAIFGVPISLVSLVDAERQVFKSRQGLEAQGTPREHAFCSHTILTREALIVSDASRDPRFADNPLVTGEPGIRFYAGFPLITSVGFRLGTFCLIDTVPRNDFDDAKSNILEDLAVLAMSGLDAEREQHAEPSVMKEKIAAEDAQFAAITTVAHDIRAPLGAIVSLANVMESETFGPLGDNRYKQYSSDIVRTGLFLVDLSRKVLDVARLRSGEIEISEETLQVSAILDEAASLVANQAAQRSLHIKTQAKTANVLLRADKTLVLQMLVNLLSNAIKYSREGRYIGLEAHEHQEGTLDFTIIDQGIGMSEDEVALALKPFGRIDGQSDYNDDGIGLGLSLVQQLMALHGGRLLIESQRGIGTAATLRFPLFRIMKDAA
jgi:signal transduction histidine kinase